MKAEIKQGETPVYQGLSDGGHVYLRCSNCDAYLLDAWVTRPHEDDTWKLRCNCPFCDEDRATAGLGGSYVVEVRGGFTPGGIGVPRDGSDTDDIASTLYEDFEIDGDVFTFKVAKAARDAQPVRRL